MCVYFTYESQDLQFKVFAVAEIFFEKLFMTFKNSREFLPEICRREVAEEILCVLILYVCGGTFSLTSTPYDLFLSNFFMAGFCLKSVERKSWK